MQIIRQVIKDLFKGFGWVVFYGLLTAITMMAFIFINHSFNHVMQKNDSTLKYIQNDISFTQIKNIQYNSKTKTPNIVKYQSDSETLMNYFNEVFTHNGKGGSFFIMSNRLGYNQVIIFMGIFTEMTPFQMQQSQDIIFAVSNDLKEKASPDIEFGNKKYPLHIAPKNMDIYHPLHYISSESELMENTMFIFSKDYKGIKDLFPEYKYWELKDQEFLGRFILKSPDVQDVIRLRKVVIDNIGAYVTTESINDFLKNTENTGVRTHQIYMSFYLIAAVVLVGAMFINIYRILRNKVTDYSIHHLFGASKKFIFFRMFLFALAYQVIPMIGILLVMYLNELATLINVLLLFSSMLFVVFLITSIVYKYFIIKFSEGLRGE
nr:hypothetical protein [Tissierella sp.]